jgi:hypothetical protein
MCYALRYHEKKEKNNRLKFLHQIAASAVVFLHPTKTVHAAFSRN